MRSHVYNKLKMKIFENMTLLQEPLKDFFYTPDRKEIFSGNEVSMLRYFERLYYVKGIKHLFW